MSGHILVVSRTPELIQRLRGALEPHGFSVTVVLPDADLAEEIRLNRPGVVILALGPSGPEEWAFESRTMSLLGGRNNPDRPALFVLTARYIQPDGGRYDFDMYLREDFNPLELRAYTRRVMGLGPGR
jgi:DNA-binding response OmpR family regulator